MHPLPWPAAEWPRRRETAWAILLLAVLLAHLWLLRAAWPGTSRRAVATPSQPTTTMHLVARSASAVAADLQSAPQEPAATPAQSAPLPPLPPRPARAPAQLKSAAPVQAAAGALASQGHEAPPPQPMRPAHDATAGDAEVPVYATRVPDPARLHYRLQRGSAVGSGSLHWQRRGEAYELAIDAELQGVKVLGSASRGVIDADGVAPLRYADLRRERELRAANFQRDAGRISFSGPQIEYPLLPGAQDRLSWMIQLPAIVEADAALARPGASVTLFVVGTRGDAQAWRFEVQGSEALELPAGAVPDALRLLREPSRPYDTRVEVWLDPARQHLPVRALFTTVPGGQPLELMLSGIDARPL